MTMLDSPFIVGLKYAYETPTEVHLVLGIMTGGDLGYHLRRKGIFNKLETKYYICRTILGIKTLHSFNIIFRDLKPDNILMDGRGRTALSDLGLAVVVPRNGITGACGTRGYWAPEMLSRNEDGSRVRYNLSVDWFSLGCVLYQFMSGVCPFRKMGEVVRREAVENGEEITKDDAIDKAVRELDPVFAPELFNEEAIDLIKRLLCKDGKTRLGAVGGAAEVMAHPFFADVNWQEYQDDSIKPPCLPRKDLNYATQNEIGGFAPEEQSGDALTAADREVFSHWNYTRPNAFMEEVVSFMQHEDELGPIQVRTEDSVCCVIS
jgi:beta-adrenergic-receptor kinase